MPLCQVVLTMHNTPWVVPRLGELVLEGVVVEDFQVRFDLTVHAWEINGKMGFSWIYDRDVFAGWRVEQMAGHYARVLEAIIGDTAQMLSAIRLLTPGEREDLLREQDKARSAKARTVTRPGSNYRFSKGAWLKAHPEGDIARAIKAAIAHGLVVID